VTLDVSFHGSPNETISGCVRLRQLCLTSAAGDNAVWVLVASRASGAFD
jgi:hypothetical protein